MNDYNSASDCARPVPCEGKRLPANGASYELTKKEAKK